MNRPISLYVLLTFVFCTCAKEPNNAELLSQKDASRVKATPPSSASPPDPVNELADALSGINPGILVSQIIRSIFQDSRGNLWFGTLGEGIVRYDGRTLKYFGKGEILRNDKGDEDDGISVHAIAEDKNGNVWFGTDHGAIKYDGNTFVRYSEKNGLTNIKVGRKSILVDNSGNIWVGTEGGVFRYDPSADDTGGKCFSQFHLLAPVSVKDIMEDRDGNIWFATQNNGVFRYDGAQIKNIIGKSGLGDNYAGGMVQDNAGNFWFTMKNGICRYDGGTFAYFTTKDGLGGSEVWGIYMEKSGVIWITARGSTTRYCPSILSSNAKAFTVFTEEDGLNCCVQSMYQDRSGNMWFGTGQGLYRFDGKRFYQVKKNGPW